MIKRSKLYLQIWLLFALALICACIFAFSLSQLNSLKTQERFLKHSFKLNELLLQNQLTKKLVFLKLHIKEIKEKEFIPPNSPLTQLISLHHKQIKKVYSTSSEKTIEQKKPMSAQINIPLTPSKKTKTQTFSHTEKNLSQIEQITADIPLNKTEVYFTKIKTQNKNQLLGVISLDKDQKELLFFKSGNSFFKMPLSNSDIYFTAANHQNLVVFYNKLIKKNRRTQILKFLSKKELKSSKYISIKSKKNSSASFYYLSEWKPAGLYLMIQAKNSSFISQSAFTKQKVYIWVLTLTAVLLFFSLFAVWLKLSSLFSAYSFLKSAVISFSNKGQFPLSQSKNPMLYFYNNRTAFLNKKEENKEVKGQAKNQTFQSLIKKELELLKSSYPNISVKEDYQSNVKIFGNERFLKTVIHELLLNALESMGAAESQKIDLSLLEEQNNIVFSIRDYGTGLLSAKKAFQMYYSTKSQLGVGLNLVQSIVKAKGGTIKLQEIKEAGAKVLVSFPLKAFLKQY